MPAKSKTNIRLSSAVQRYLDRIRNEKQSATSQYTARYALARFQKAVATKGDPDPYVHLITDSDMDTYFYGAGGISENIKSVSLNRYRSVLVQFFRYAEDLRWTDISPMAGIKPARPDQPVSRLLLSATEMVQLLDMCGNPIERIGCSLGMNTGLRANDIRHLTVFDANLNNGTIQTEIRKTKKLDIKPITMELDVELHRWLDIYADIAGLPSRHDLPNEWRLVPTYRNAAPRERSQYGVVPNTSVNPKTNEVWVHGHPWVLVQRPLAKLGYPTKGEGFHTLRRSSARALFESLRDANEGRDHALMIVKDFLNHASTAQTEHYLGLNQERTMRDALLRGKSFLPQLASKQQNAEGVSHVNGGRQTMRPAS